MKVKIKSCNGGLPEYLTMGRVYDVVDTNSFGKKCNYQYIKDDMNRLLVIAIENSNILNGGSWEIVE